MTRSLRVGAPLAAVVLLLSAWVRHPLHMTVAELTYDDAARAARVSIRAFADDFLSVAARHAGRPQPADSASGDTLALAYAAARFGLSDAAGRPLSLQPCGLRRAGDAVFLCLSGAAPAGLKGVTVRDELLTEAFDDQVNIVQASYAGRKANLLFTRGDPPKRLP